MHICKNNRDNGSNDLKNSIKTFMTSTSQLRGIYAIRCQEMLLETMQKAGRHHKNAKCSIFCCCLCFDDFDRPFMLVCLEMSTIEEIQNIFLLK